MILLHFNLVKNESLLATVRISCSRSPASFSTNLDSNLREILSKEGIVLARRTVAKYRKMENIPSSFARKRRNVIAGAI